MKKGIISINRFKKSKTSGLVNYARDYLGPISVGTLPPEYTSAVGASQFSRNGVIQKFGKGGMPINGTKNLYSHLVITYISDGEINNYPIVKLYISSGPIANPNAPSILAKDAMDWLVDSEINTVTMKKINNGSYIQVVIKEDLVAEGNYVLAFETKMDWLAYATMLTQLERFYGLTYDTAVEVFETIGMFRDATIWLYPTVSTSIQLIWAAAYNADSNDEKLFLLDSKGKLVYQISIDKNNLAGNVLIPMNGGEQYQLVIPGYSYRNYSVKAPVTMKYLLEPSKLQFMGVWSEDSPVYFKVMPGEQAYVCMKNYNSGGITGPTGMTLTQIGAPAGTPPLVMPISPKKWYYEHEKMALPVSDQEQWYRMLLTGGAGRASFWLDGIPNVFSFGLSAYRRPVFNPSQVIAQVPPGAPQRVGKMVKLGIYFPYEYIPADAAVAYARLQPEVGNVYTFLNVIQRNPGRETFRDFMTNQLGVKIDWTIMANDNGLSWFVDTDPISLQGVDNMFQNLIDMGGDAEHYISLADEPNNNYPSYQAFEDYFVRMADYINAHPLKAAARVHVALPASSRFNHGSTNDSALERLGEAWCKRLLTRYKGEIGGITWHDWTVRHLLSLRQYTETVEAGYEYTNNGQRRMSIEQTNTAGGSSVALYDQNSHYATMWYASVIINSARPGKLDDLLWFPAADVDDHPKGQFYVGATNPVPGRLYDLKPVGLFTEYMSSYLKGFTNTSVYTINYSGIEVDMLYFSGDKPGVRKYTVMGANKSKRVYTANIRGLDWVGAPTLWIWDEANVAHQAAWTKNASGDYIFDVPPMSVFYLTVDKPM